MFLTAVWILGWSTTILSGLMIFPALISFGFSENDVAFSFLFSFGLSLFAGIGLILTARGSVSIIDTRTTILLSVLIWPTISLFSCIPFMLSGSAESFVDAYFESVSGIVTSGSTIFSNVTDLPKGILFWRGMLQWIGGFSTILLVLSFFSLAGIGGMNLFHSSMPRSERDTVVHRFWQSIKSLWWVYLILTVICAFSLRIAGMDLFDSVVHAFSTISTGGFSTHSNSISYFNNYAIEIVLIIFMILGALNFTLYWAFVNGQWKEFFRDGETIYFFIFLFLSSLIGVIFLIYFSYFTLNEGIRFVIFNVVSSISTTGFHLSSNEFIFSQYNIFPVLLSLLMLIGGASVSTAGGVKQLRIIVFFKLTFRELFKLSHPHGVTSINYMGKSIDEKSLRSTWGFLMTFISLLAICSVFFGLCGLNLEQSLTLTVATVSNTGAGLNMISPDQLYFEMSDTLKWLVIFSQYIGRIEVIVILIVINPIFWRK